MRGEKKKLPHLLRMVRPGNPAPQVRRSKRKKIENRRILQLERINQNYHPP